MALITLGSLYSDGNNVGRNVRKERKMAYKMTIDFSEPNEENLETLNEILSNLKFSSIEMTEVEGKVGHYDYIEYLFTYFYSELFYSIKSVTFFCAESTISESHTYQTDITVYSDKSRTDIIAFHLAWCNEHPDRVIKSVQHFFQDNYTIYVIVSQKREECDELVCQLKEMPTDKAFFHYKRDFTPEQMEILKKGRTPMNTLEHWFWYEKGGTLYSHRTLTGSCIYKIDISELTGDHLVEANRSSDV